MNPTTAEPKPPPPDSAMRTHNGREGLLVFGVSAALTAIIVGLGSVIPFLGANSVALVALVFLYLPGMALRRAKIDPIGFGLGWDRITHGIPLGILAVFVVLVPFVCGFHIWEHRAFDHQLDVRVDNYRALPEALRFEPSEHVRNPAEQGAGILLWRYQRDVVIRWQGEGSWRIDVESDGLLEHRRGQRWRHTQSVGINAADPSSHRWEIRAEGTGELVFWTRGVDWLSIRAELDGEVLPSGRTWHSGTWQDDGDEPRRFRRSWLWIPLALLVQLLLVALPEEYFYRGYLQARLDRGTRWHLGPFHTSPAILMTSTLFALGHFAVGLDPQRLAVFFPSLAFGWLRDKSNGLGASIVFHAACNLMVEMTVVHYWPV